MGVKELQDAGGGLLDRILVALVHPVKGNLGRNMGEEVAAAEFGQDFGQVIAHEAVPGGVIGRVDNRHLPAGQVGVQSVQEGRVLKFCGQHGEQVQIRVR